MGSMFSAPFKLCTESILLCPQMYWDYGTRLNNTNFLMHQW
jgi:hypothetical protein